MNLLKNLKVLKGISVFSKKILQDLNYRMLMSRKKCKFSFKIFFKTVCEEKQFFRNLIYDCLFYTSKNLKNTFKIFFKIFKIFEIFFKIFKIFSSE